MSSSYPIAISHTILAGSSIYCLSKLPPTPTVAHGTFGIILVNSLLGAWKWVTGDDDCESSVNILYTSTGFLQNIYALPCITSTVWMSSGYSWTTADLHIAYPLVPLFTYFFQDDPREDIVNVQVCISAIGLGWVAYEDNSIYGCAAALIYAVNHFIVGTKGDYGDRIIYLDLYNIILVAFEYCALLAVTQGSGAE